MLCPGTIVQSLWGLIICGAYQLQHIVLWTENFCYRSIGEFYAMRCTDLKPVWSAVFRATGLSTVHFDLAYDSCTLRVSMILILGSILRWWGCNVLDVRGSCYIFLCFCEHEFSSSIPLVHDKFKAIICVNLEWNKLTLCWCGCAIGQTVSSSRLVQYSFRWPCRSLRLKETLVARYIASRRAATWRMPSVRFSRALMHTRTLRRRFCSTRSRR